MPSSLYSVVDVDFLRKSNMLGTFGEHQFSVFSLVLDVRVLGDPGTNRERKIMNPFSTTHRYMGKF